MHVVLLCACVHTHLRDDLAEDGDDDRRQGETDEAGREIRHHDRQQGVHRHVAEEERAQQQVAVRPHRRDFLAGGVQGKKVNTLSALLLFFQESRGRIDRTSRRSAVFVRVMLPHGCRGGEA